MVTQSEIADGPRATGQIGAHEPPAGRRRLIRVREANRPHASRCDKLSSMVSVDASEPAVSHDPRAAREEVAVRLGHGPGGLG